MAHVFFPLEPKQRVQGPRHRNGKVSLVLRGNSCIPPSACLLETVLQEVEVVLVGPCHPGDITSPLTWMHALAFRPGPGRLALRRVMVPCSTSGLPCPLETTHTEPPSPLSP